MHFYIQVINEGPACKKKSVATGVLDIVSERNVDDKRERARVKKRKQREKTKKLETERDKETRLRLLREQVSHSRRERNHETELEKNKRRCSERLRSRNFRNHQEVKDDDEQDGDIPRAIQEGLCDLHRTKDANNALNIECTCASFVMLS